MAKTNGTSLEAKAKALLALRDNGATFRLEANALSGATPAEDSQASGDVRLVVTSNNRPALSNAHTSNIVGKRINEVSLDDGETVYECTVNKEITQHLLDNDDLLNIPVQIPQQIALPNGYSAAHVELTPDSDGLSDLLIVRSRTQSADALKKNLVNSKLLPEGQNIPFLPAEHGDGYVAAIRISHEVLEAIIAHEDNNIKPLHDYEGVELNSEALKTISDIALTQIAASHLPQQEKTVSETATRQPQAPNEKPSSQPKPLTDYAGLLTDSDIHFQLRRNFNGSLNHYIYLNPEHQGDLVTKLTDSEQCAPAIELSPRGQRAINGYDDKYNRYLVSKDDFDALNETTGYAENRQLNDVPFRFKDRQIGSSSAYSEKGQFDGYIESLTIAPDPENEERCRLYVAANTEHQMHARYAHNILNALNNSIGVPHATRITEAELEEYPAVQYFSIPTQIADDILQQKNDLEALEEEQPSRKKLSDLIVDARRALIGKDSDALDAFFREKFSVTHWVEEKKAPAPKAVDRRSLPKDKQQELDTLKLNRFIEGLAKVQASQAERDLKADPPLIAIAPVKRGKNSKTDVIARVNHKELDILRTANKTEFEGKAYDFVPSLNEQSNDGDIMVNFTLEQPDIFRAHAGQHEIELTELAASPNTTKLEERRFKSVKALKTFATNHFAERVEALTQKIEDDMPREQQAFRAFIRSKPVTIKLKHLSEEELSTLITGLKAADKFDATLPNMSQSFTEQADALDALIPLAGMITVGSTQASEMLAQKRDGYRKAANLITGLGKGTKEWQNKVKDDAATASKKDDGISNMMIALEVRESDIPIIQSLATQSGNRVWFEDASAPISVTGSKRKIMHFIPTQDFLDEAKAYDASTIMRNLRDSGYETAEIISETQRRLKKRWSPIRDEPVNASDVLELLKELSSNKPIDPLETLSDAVERQDGRIINQTISKLLETALSQDVRSELSLARDAVALHDTIHHAQLALQVTYREEASEHIAEGKNDIATLEKHIAKLKPAIVKERYEAPDTGDFRMPLLDSNAKIPVANLMALKVNRNTVSGACALIQMLDDTGLLAKPYHYVETDDIPLPLQDAMQARDTAHKASKFMSVIADAVKDLNNHELEHFKTNILPKLETHLKSFNDYCGAAGIRTVDRGIGSLINLDSEPDISVTLEHLQGLANDLKTTIKPYYTKQHIGHSLPDVGEEFVALKIARGDSSLTDLTGKPIRINDLQEMFQNQGKTSRRWSEKTDTEMAFKLYLTDDALALLEEMKSGHKGKNLFADIGDQRPLSPKQLQTLYETNPERGVHS